MADDAAWERERDWLDEVSPGRRLLELIPVPDVGQGDRRTLFRVTTPAQLEVARRIGGWLRMETGNGFPPDPVTESRDRVTLLIRSTVLSVTPLAGGAADLQRWGDRWVLLWVWLFPLDRSRGREWWEALEAEFGDFAVQAPLSKAMAGLLDKVDKGRACHPEVDLRGW